jgi:hypothetical protein
MQKKVITCIFALVITVASVGMARADAILTFTPSTLSTAAGMDYCKPQFRFYNK